MTEKEIIQELYKAFHNQDLRKFDTFEYSGDYKCPPLKAVSKIVDYHIVMNQHQHYIEFIFEKLSDREFYINLTPYDLVNQQTIEERDNIINGLINY